MLLGLHLLLTYRCTHACDHCFVYGSPEARGTFTSARVGEALSQAVAVGTIERIYFEGGEPFLYYPLLLDGLRRARDLGFSTGVVTNAYWAESVQDALLWLEPLRDLEVADLSVSDDAFHAEETGETPAARAREAARRLGMPVQSLCVPQPEEGEGVRFRGRAADRLVAGRAARPWRTFDACPDEDLARPERVHLDAEGHVHLCQGVLMGNAWATPLADLLAAWGAEEDPVSGPLVRGGPAALAEAHGVGVEPTYVSACHLCYEVRRRLRSRLPDRLGPGQVYGESPTSGGGADA